MHEFYASYPLFHWTIGHHREGLRLKGKKLSSSIGWMLMMSSICKCTWLLDASPCNDEDKELRLNHVDRWWFMGKLKDNLVVSRAVVLDKNGHRHAFLTIKMQFWLYACVFVTFKLVILDVPAVPFITSKLYLYTWWLIVSEIQNICHIEGGFHKLSAFIFNEA